MQCLGKREYLVGLLIATLLSQHHQVTAVDTVSEKVDLINNRNSPNQGDYIEKYLVEKELNLTATLDVKTVYSDSNVEKNLLCTLIELLKLVKIHSYMN